MKDDLSKKITLLVFSFIFIFAFFLMGINKSLSDPDTFWHIELGREMIEQKTIIKEAVHTYAGEQLPYVPHEVGFQIIVGFLYTWHGWNGVYLLTLVSTFILSWGIYRLINVSIIEQGIEEKHPFLFIVLLPITTLYVYVLYFSIRPQMLSIGIILWFFIWLRESNITPSLIGTLKLGFMSFILSNIHAGVWPVIIVFFVMNLIEKIYKKNVNGYDIMTLIFILIGGAANIGGLRSITYFFTVKDSSFTPWIQEWQPIDFSTNYYFFINVILFIWSAVYSVRKDLFRFLFMIGILYLGLSNFKQHVFLIVFFPYFFATAIEDIKLLDILKSFNSLVNKKFILILITTGIAVSFTTSQFIKYEVPKDKFPVEEMNFILKNFTTNERPKVLGEYHVSGYIMFKGGDILADGRFDPFILEKTKNINNWTAFERSAYAFKSEFLIDIINSDHPDYVIIPNEENPKRITLTYAELKKAKEQLGEPIFKGSYGEIWDLSCLYNSETI